mmetsp:Transcript_82863/g.208761  ORF Transcript_82863/g.208761 Transcript_82863/m.208761 type:complete len:236 (-) Transcript_82863:1158-1865(-)
MLVYGVEVRLVHEAHVQALAPQSLYGIKAAVECIAVGNYVAKAARADDVVLAKLELVALTKEGSTDFVQDYGYLGARAVDEAQALLPEDAINDLAHLKVVSREDELCQRAALVSQATISKEVVLPEVAHVVGHVVHATVAEVAEDVALVQSRHGDLTDHHLLEGGKGAEDCLAVALEAEASASAEVTALHDAAADVDLRAFGADLAEAAGAFEVAVNHNDPPLTLFGTLDATQIL